jgi:Sulfotransferase family
VTYSPTDIDSPIFIVGVPRSGTTLMAAMLSAHSQVAISPETHFFNYWLARWSTLSVEEFWSLVTQSVRFSYLGINADEAWQQAHIEAQNLAQNTAQSLTHQHLLSATLRLYAQQLQKVRWGEKTPMHYQHLDQIFDWYPQARVIWMLRDPRATVASLMQVDWAAPYTQTNARLWQQSRALYYQHWVSDPRVYLVRYETLITESVQQLQAICQFLQIPYEQQMIEYRSSTQSPMLNRQGWAKTHLQQALSPIQTNSLDQWKQQLSTAQIEIIEQESRGEMHQDGYIPMTQGMTWRGEFQLKQDQVNQRLRKPWQRWQKSAGTQRDLADTVHGITPSKDA